MTAEELGMKFGEKLPFLVVALIGLYFGRKLLKKENETQIKKTK